MKPVSVIIPARDAQATLADALDSLLAQDLPDWQAIIVDDGSSDATGAIAAGYCERDPRFTLVAADGLGVSMARNEGLRHAEGESVLFLDADDWIVPGHLSRMAAALDHDPDADASYCGYVRVTPAGQAFLPRFDPRVAVEPRNVLARSNPLQPNGVLVKRKQLESLGGFIPGLRTCEDWDLWQRLARGRGRFAPVPGLYAPYRLRPGSASANVEQLYRDATVLLENGDPDKDAMNLAWFTLWCRGVAAGQDRQFAEDASALPAIPVGPDEVRSTALSIMEALCTGACCTPSRIARNWTGNEERIASLLQASVEPGGHDAVLDCVADLLGIDRANRADQVSVVIPAFKATETIGETLQSVQTQTHASLDIVVVDDGSPDGTAEAALAFAAHDPRICVMGQANAGVAAARNLGWKTAASDYIAFVDADDLWAPAKVERQLAALKAEGEQAGLAYTWYARIDEGSLITSRSHKPDARGDVLQAIFLGNFIGNGSAALMTRAALEHAGGFDSTLRARGAQGCEDFSIYFRIAEKYRFALVPEPLTGYRVMAGNMSSDMLRMLRSFDLVVSEMLERHPQHRADVMAGRRYYLEWSLLTAIERGDFKSGFKLFRAYLRQSRRDAVLLLSKMPRAMLRGLRLRIVGAPRRRRDYAPIRFPIGHYEESHG
ncbi:glycosyltransferase family 2 protein [Novosphingobium malaysiense]|uniref:glycosyltransferase family 2 protein n=1 Tax=Novosphingobium malaysiense TaxID=1348853 RepID=UPI0009DD6D19|nr:glycosyltransferase [Novosphingobium malaysiense]